MTTPLRIECELPIHRHGRGAAQAIRPGSAPSAVAPPRLPRIARLMALALRFDQLVRTGAVPDYATLARLGKVTRARISQLMNLLHLAPDIQESLLFLPPLERGRAPILLADLQSVARQADWRHQRRRWHEVCALRKLKVPTADGALA